MPANTVIVNPLPVSTLAITLTLAGCADKPPLERLLADLEVRVEARDTDGVVKLLAADFKGQDGIVRATVPGELRRYFFGYESLDVTFSDLTPDGTPPHSLRLRVDLSGRPKDVAGLAGLLPAISAYRFELGLRSTGERLEITSARWERIDIAE